MIDPSSLNLEGFWGGKYVGTPVAGLSSAGSSGSRSLTANPDAPYISKQINGLTGMEMNGVGHSGVPNKSLKATGTLGTYISTTRYNGSMIALVRSIPTNFEGNSDIINNACALAGADGYFAIGFRDDPVDGPLVFLAHYAGDPDPTRYDRVEHLIDLNTPHIIQWSYDSSTHDLKIGVDGDWSTQSDVQVMHSGGLGFDLHVGRNFNGSQYVDGDLWNLQLSKADNDTATLDGVKDFLVDQYDLPDGFDDAPVAGAPFQPVTIPNDHEYEAVTLTSVMNGIEVPMDGCKIHWFLGKYWALGGWHPDASWAPDNSTNRVLSSPNGIDWTLRLAHDPSPPTSGPNARWGPRHEFYSFIRPASGGRPERLYVVGGDSESGVPFASDIWFTENGTTWIRVAESSPYAYPNGVQLIVGSFYRDISGDYIHIMGGCRQVDGACVLAHWMVKLENDDVIELTDWIRMPDPPIARFGILSGITMEDKIILISGAGTDVGAPTYEDTVWAYDIPARTWANQGTISWPARYWIAVRRFDNKIFALTGRMENPSPPPAAVEAGGCRYSSDLGQTWTEMDDIPWNGSHADGCAVNPFGILLATGFSLGPGSYLVRVVQNPFDEKRMFTCVAGDRTTHDSEPTLVINSEPIPNNSVIYFEAKLLGRDESTGDVACWSAVGSAVKIDGTASIVSIKETLTFEEGSESSLALCTGDVINNMGFLAIQVTGLDSTNIKWIGSISCILN